MNKSFSVTDLFDAKYCSINNQIAFNAAWNNSTGYMDHAVSGPEAVKLAAGEEATSLTAGGRRLIFIGTDLGTIVVFERYSGGTDIIVWNATRALESLLMMKHTRLNEYGLQFILGSSEATVDGRHEMPNIGERLKHMRYVISSEFNLGIEQALTE